MKLKEEFKIAGFFYLMSALFWIAIGIMGAYWTLYLYNLGISFASISLILLMVPISSLLFEIPTGAIADIFGRKISVFYPISSADWLIYAFC
jgi:MFS family permease